MMMSSPGQDRYVHVLYKAGDGSGGAAAAAHMHMHGLGGADACAGPGMQVPGGERMHMSLTPRHRFGRIGGGGPFAFDGTEEDDHNPTEDLTEGCLILQHELMVPDDMAQHSIGDLNMYSDTRVKEERKRQVPKKKAKRKPRASKGLAGEGGEDEIGVPKGTKKFVCERCCAAFRTNYHLQRHVLIHTGEKAYQCSQCTMRFIQKYLLQRHEKIHSGEKPFTCEQCGMRFIQKYHLERHKRTHSGEKPYECDYCHQYYSRTDQLAKHKRMCHEGPLAGKHDMNAGDFTAGINGGMDALQGTTQGPRRWKKRASGTVAADGSAGPPASGRGSKKKKNTAGLPGGRYTGEKRLVNVECIIEMGGQLEDGSLNLVDISEDALTPKLVPKKANRGRRRRASPELSRTVPIDALAVMHHEQHKGALHDEDKLLGDPGAIVATDADGDKSSSEPANKLQAHAQQQQQQHETSGNTYGDAMQFLKKRRYLQAASNGNCGGGASGVNVGGVSVLSISTSPRVAPEPIMVVSNQSMMDDGHLQVASMEVPSLILDIKADPDKVGSGIPDEVLQTILDHYSAKDDFGMGDGLHESAHRDAADVTSQSASPDKAAMLQEYYKYLQQALDRSSKSDHQAATTATALSSGVGVGVGVGIPFGQLVSTGRHAHGDVSATPVYFSAPHEPFMSHHVHHHHHHHNFGSSLSGEPSYHTVPAAKLQPYGMGVGQGFTFAESARDLTTLAHEFLEPSGDKKGDETSGYGLEDLEHVLPSPFSAVQSSKQTFGRKTKPASPTIPF
ncbi:zinc finger protein 148-like isoform X1 [Lampetra fluviatilis]